MVCMYKDTPGVYIDLNERLLPEKLAKQAGYDVEMLGKKRRRLEALKRVTEKINKDFDHEEANIVREVDGLGIQKFGEGRGARFNVIDMATGEALNSMPLKRAEADKILDDITSPEELEPENGGLQHDPDEGETAGH